MPTKKKSAKSARKSSAKMRDLKPSKDAKGGAVHHLGAKQSLGVKRFN